LRNQTGSRRILKKLDEALPAVTQTLKKKKKMGGGTNFNTQNQINESLKQLTTELV
jgi:hypothetical protein